MSNSTTQRSGAAVGWIFFASIMLLIIGFMQVFAGIAALAKDGSTIYANVADNSYILSLDTTSWGWWHILLGIIVILAGIGVLAGRVWARTVGVIVAAISAIANFAFIPIYPVWAIVIIAIDVTIIWALTAHGRDITED
jgi:hypothetical protein